MHGKRTFISIALCTAYGTQPPTSISQFLTISPPVPLLKTFEALHKTSGFLERDFDQLLPLLLDPRLSSLS